MLKPYQRIIASAVLSLIFLTGCLSAEEREFKAALKLAEKGDVTAQMKVGELYLTGKGTEKNLSQSVDWYRKAADQAHTDAFRWLMTQSYNGNVEASQVIRKMQDDGNIFLAHWVLEMAKQNRDAAAEYTVGWMYDTGKGLIKDQNLARIWYEKSAAQNYPLAIKVLGNKHLFNSYDDSSDATAMNYLNEAANQHDDPDAAVKIAHYYHYELRDGEKAREWYAKAGRLGDTHAKNMAETYEEWKAEGPLQPNEPNSVTVMH